jgi:hypothetical protein
MNILFKRKGKNFVVISYYTEDTIYAEQIKRLIASLEKFELDYYIEGIPSLGSWKDATDYKATFILRALTRVKAPVVFIDADGEVVQYPQLFENLNNIDIAAFYSHINHLWSGTLYLNNCDKVRYLIENWIEANKINKVLFEQRILQSMIAQNKTIKLYKLPISYCQIYDHKFKSKFPVIVQHQASRITKKLNIPSFSEEELVNLYKEIEKVSNNLWITY